MVKSFENIEGIKNLFFICECKSNYNGFKHIVTLYNNYDVNFEHKTSVQYYNRTWERYEYETALNSCVNECILEIVEDTKKAIKEKHGLKRWSGKHQMELGGELSKNQFYNQLMQLKAEILK